MKKILVSMLIALCTCGVLAAQDRSTVWVTMGEDVFGQLSRAPGVFTTPLELDSFGSDSGVVITRLPV